MTASVGVHGPDGLVEKAPCGELDASVTVTGCVSACATPASCSCTESGPEGVPAASVTGAVVKPSAGADQVVNPFHASLNAAPGSDSVHVPAQAASGAAAES